MRKAGKKKENVRKRIERMKKLHKHNLMRFRLWKKENKRNFKAKSYQRGAQKSGTECFFRTKIVFL